MTHTLTLTAGRRAVNIRSDSSSVTDWAAQYFGPYWLANPSTGTKGPTVTATDADHQASAPLAHPQHAVFARERIGYTRHPDGTVTAHTLSDPVLGYHYNAVEQHLVITSRENLTASSRPGRPTRLATATTRFAREMMRAQLIAEGWVLLHASAATFPGGRTLLALGDSGAGKTTTALTLASHGAALLANDCCFARPHPDGTLRLLPWPSAAAIGLGLLKALPLSTAAGHHLQAGEPPHPTQHQRVTDALINGQIKPLRSESGRELKAHIWPEQLTRWLGLTLATSGTATAVLLPRITPSHTAPACIDTSRDAHVTTDAFVTSDTERYPDLFGFHNGSNAGLPNAQAAVLQHLNRLPRHAIRLSYNHEANRGFLTTLAAPFVPAHGHGRRHP
ncbi:hypothetical protein OG393_33470 (plasmid) [Streptomyces sp. NBC_01216]|uniref:hypothetical protein n=1 Tax=Streptomyces sp. NBC_01216 TaxID=2903778 RepID=UPI002E1472B8|nr:hypothetical protein OG393_33470 [Streptomyces sp. NBC_01216]